VDGSWELRAALSIASAAWAGGWIALVAVAAPTLFASQSSRSSAGALFGEMLRRYGAWEVVWSLVVFGAAMLLWWRGDPATRGRLAWVGALIAVFVVNRIVLAPWMAAVRDQISSFDEEPADESQAALRVRFRMLHWIASVLTLVQVALALVVAGREWGDLP
jgi:hypothetical protein